MNSNPTQIVASATIALLLVASGTARAQKNGGFGGLSKDVIKVTSVRPPKIIVSQSSFSVSVGGPAVDDGIQAQISGALRTAVQEASPTITFVDSNGKLRIAVSIDTLAFATAQSTRTVKKSKGYGKTRQEWTENHTFVTVTSSFRASYRAEDWTGRTPVALDSDTLSLGGLGSVDFDLNENQAPPTRELARQAYSDALVRRLRPRLARFREEFSVLLGDVDGHKLERGNNLAKAGLWKSAYDDWTSQPAFQTPKAESYRVYNKAVALEAMGYQEFLSSGNAEAALTQFAEAEKLYKQALMMNPDEKYFRQDWRKGVSPAPIERIQATARDYTEILNQANAVALAMAASAPSSRPPDAGSGSKDLNKLADGPDAMTNDDVIQLVAKKASQAFIRETIRAAPRTQFDMSPKGRISLIDARVPEALITYMAAHNNRGGPKSRKATKRKQ